MHLEHLMSSTTAVSWSKIGLIAYGDAQSQDGNLCITFLETVNGSNWRFHPPKKYVIHPQLHEDQSSNGNPKSPLFFHDLRSMHWNNWGLLNGELLAVCDELGNMTVLAAGQGLNGNGAYDRLSVLFQDNIFKIHNQVLPLESVPKKDATPKVERKHTKKEYYSTILDFQWIGNQKPSVAQVAAQRDRTNNIFKNQMHQCPPYGVFHPASIKSACIAIRRNGYIDLWYQFSNTLDFKKISLQLSKDKESEWLQYAQIAHTDKEQCFLIGVFSNVAKSFAFYELLINWNVNTTNQAMFHDPKLTLRHILRVRPDALGPNGELLKLENFHVISKTALPGTRPEILISYNILGTERSLVRRFQMVLSNPDMVFLSSLGLAITALHNNHSVLRYSMKHVQDLTFDSKIMDIQSHSLDALVCFRLHNGRFQLYNRHTWAVESETADAKQIGGYTKDTIISIFGNGFNYPLLPPADAIEWCAISPSSGGIILKLKCKPQPTFYALEQSVLTDPSRDIVHATAFAFEFVRFNNMIHSGEDLAIAAKTHVFRLQRLSEERAVNFIASVIGAILSLYGIHFDGPKEILEKLLQSKAIQKIFLLQMELGSHLKNKNVYSMAYASMKLRSINLAMNGVARNVHAMIQHTAVVNSLPNGRAFQFAFSKQDLIYSLIPSVNWFVSFVTFLTQQLIMLVNNPMDNTHSLVLGILSCITTRHLMLKVILELKNMIGLITKFPETTYTVLNESSRFLRKALGDSPVNLEKFEVFLNEINNKFLSLLDDHGAQSMDREPSFMVKAEIPPALGHVREFLLSFAGSALLAQTNLAEVFFASTHNLRIFDHQHFHPSVANLLQPPEKGLVVDDAILPDACRGSSSFSPLDYDDISSEWVDMSALVRIKRCVRCGCVTRAGNPVAKNNTILETSIVTKRWTALYSRYCQCTGLLYELDTP
ncbi:FABL202Wp [Eremothecium gossypii FDAG1]|nr:FABL202Wp [Eremothecium gossypii FDAG1]